jgi:hypothetical protein
LRQGVQWADHPHGAFVQHVCVNHRGLDVSVTQQLLHLADALSGFITDLASMPWIAGILGINRNNKSNWMDLGAVLHDGLYYGAAKLSENRRRNRKLADQLLLDVWHWSSGKRFRPRVRYAAVRLGGWVPYNPD